VIGHEFNVLDDAILEAQKVKGKPTIILMKTNMGHGVDFMAGTHKWHGVAPNDDELKNALGQLEETLGDY
ncbi:MAG: transketolase, partial [Cytophagaceae bacterium]|nr:transketolase [Cytophagaceae bacterium]